MKCPQCGGKFKADDKILVLYDEDLLLHEGECFSQYILDNYFDEQNYLEYLEVLIKSIEEE